MDMLGVERLALWGIGEPDSCGISSFTEFLDQVETEYATHLATYDGEELDIREISEELDDEFGSISPDLAFRRRLNPTPER